MYLVYREIPYYCRGFRRDLSIILYFLTPCLRFTEVSEECIASISRVEEQSQEISSKQKIVISIVTAVRIRNLYIICNCTNLKAVKVSLCLIKNHAMKTNVEVEVQLHHS
jgi:hypothetical protein